MMKLIVALTLLAIAQADCTKKSCLFSFTNPDGQDNGRCGEVDAAPRMPDDIWKDQRAVAEYVLATTKWYHVQGGTLKQKPCERTGYTQKGSQNSSWTDPELMKRTCYNSCGCNYPACSDTRPDVPRNHEYCSLCGPKFNQPIEVKFWVRDGPAPGPAPGPAGCTKKSCPFSFTNPRSVSGGRCGEVDAAPRMPDDIWKDQRAVAEYVLATTKWYHLAIGGGTLKQSLCNHDWTKKGSQNVSWTDPELMKRTCFNSCGCNYPACSDTRPDVPRNHEYCSLCGPKFNQPIEVQFYYP